MLELLAFGLDLCRDLALDSCFLRFQLRDLGVYSDHVAMLVGVFRQQRLTLLTSLEQFFIDLLDPLFKVRLPFDVLASGVLDRLVVGHNRENVALSACRESRGIHCFDPAGLVACLAPLGQQALEVTRPHIRTLVHQGQVAQAHLSDQVVLLLDDGRLEVLDGLTQVLERFLSAGSFAFGVLFLEQFRDLVRHSRRKRGMRALQRNVYDIGAFDLLNVETAGQYRRVHLGSSVFFGRQLDLRLLPCLDRAFANDGQ